MKCLQVACQSYDFLIPILSVVEVLEIEEIVITENSSHDGGLVSSAVWRDKTIDLLNLTKMLDQDSVGKVTKAIVIRKAEESNAPDQRGDCQMIGVNDIHDIVDVDEAKMFDIPVSNKAISLLLNKTAYDEISEKWAYELKVPVNIKSLNKEISAS